MTIGGSYMNIIDNWPAWLCYFIATLYIGYVIGQYTDIENEVGREIERQLPDAVNKEITNSDSIKVIVEQLVQDKFQKLIDEKSREV
jgi:hypothetical protein